MFDDNEGPQASDPEFRAATVADYVGWLKKWLRTGKQPTHFHDYPLKDDDRWLVATKNFTLGGERGWRAASIIVPKGIRWIDGERGDNQLFFLDGPSLPGAEIPVFSDPEFEKLGLINFIRSQRAKEKKRRKITEQRLKEHEERKKAWDEFRRQGKQI